MATSVLKKIDKNGGKTISVRIPSGLHANLESVKQRAEKKGFSINITEVVTAAIQEACDNAEIELNLLQENSGFFQKK